MGNQKKNKNTQMLKATAMGLVAHLTSSMTVKNTVEDDWPNVIDFEDEYTLAQVDTDIERGFKMPPIKMRTRVPTTKPRPTGLKPKPKPKPLTPKQQALAKRKAAALKAKRA